RAGERPDRYVPAADRRLSHRTRTVRRPGAPGTADPDTAGSRTPRHRRDAMTVAANNPLVQIGDGWLIGVPDGSYTLTVKQTITPQGDVEHDFSRDFTVNI